MEDNNDSAGRQAEWFVFYFVHTESSETFELLRDTFTRLLLDIYALIAAICKSKFVLGSTDI